MRWLRPLAVACEVCPWRRQWRESPMVQDAQEDEPEDKYLGLIVQKTDSCGSDWLQDMVERAAVPP